MLNEITIENFAIIERLRIEFEPGFNVLTGETGAGKSIILDAVSMLLGARADQDVIRTGASLALVEGVFSLKGVAGRPGIAAILQREELESDDPDTLIVTREIRRGGRSICRINGRTVPLALQQEITENLIDIHGQTEHLTLLKPATHIDLLDRYGDLMEQRRAFSGLVQELTEVRRQLRDLTENAAALKQRSDLLAFQVAEIRGMELKPAEDEDLKAEANRLGNAEHLAEAASTAYQALYGGDENGASASDLFTQATLALNRLAQIDPGAQDLANLANEISIQVDEIVRSLSHYEQSIEFEPGRLSEVELRLDRINQLKRKYHCETIDELLALAAASAKELETLENSDTRIEELRGIEARMLAEIGRVGAQLSAARSEAAASLAASVEAELAELKMENARFSVAMDRLDDPAGAPVGDYRVAFDQSGIDRVEFLIAPNVGEPLKPIARIASGGETSRIMLALKTTLSRADETPTLVFDEIDAGIGGRIGAVVGLKLWSLSHNHQVFVVTHLPQLAGFADRHFRVAKHTSGGRTITEVEVLQGEKRIDELTEMLGAEAESARQSAQDILKYVDQVKARTPSP